MPVFVYNDYHLQSNFGSSNSPVTGGPIVARHCVLTGFRLASEIVGVQSDPRLCFKHLGEFVCHRSQDYKPDN